MLMGRHGRALRQFRAAARLDPDNTGAHGGVGFVLGQAGRHKRAAACHKRIAAIDPSSVFACMCAGHCLANAGLHADAAAEFDRAIGPAPGMSFEHHMRGGSLFAPGRHAEADASYEAASAAANPGNPFLWAARAASYAGAGMAAEGRDSPAKAGALRRAVSKPDSESLKLMFDGQAGCAQGDKLAAFMPGIHLDAEADRAIAAASEAAAAAGRKDKAG